MPSNRSQHSTVYGEYSEAELDAENVADIPPPQEPGFTAREFSGALIYIAVNVPQMIDAGFKPDFWRIRLSSFDNGLTAYLIAQDGGPTTEVLTSNQAGMPAYAFTKIGTSRKLWISVASTTVAGGTQAVFYHIWAVRGIPPERLL